jgi:mono/diheme cytochrome c family protein
MMALPRDLFCNLRVGGRVWPVAAWLILVAACGGGNSRRATPASADSSGPPAQPPSQAAPTTTPRVQDTSARASSPKPTAAKPLSPGGKKAAAAKDSTASAPSKPAGGGAGATQTASADAPLRDQYHTAPRDTVSQEVYNGWKQFNLNCARCHGEDVTGTTIAPHLIVSVKPDGPINSKELFISTVCSGRPAKGMPAWCSLGLEMDKIQDIYSYVKGRSDGKIAPGRPAVRSQG